MHKEIREQQKIYEIINHKIEHEDSLFNTRISWFVSLQALLFFPLFFTLSASKSVTKDTKKLTEVSTIFFDNQNNILLAIIFIGLFFCLIVALSCQAAKLRIHSLSRKYNQKIIENNLTKNLHIYPIQQIGSPPLISFLGLCAPFGSIVIFSKLWLYLAKISPVDHKDLYIILSSVIVTIVDYIFISNLFDCLFDYIFNKDRMKRLFPNISKSFFHWLLLIIVIQIEWYLLFSFNFPS